MNLFNHPSYINKTLITQEMLKKGFLASTTFYASIAHDTKVIEKYFDNLDDIYSLISKCENVWSIQKNWMNIS